MKAKLKIDSAVVLQPAARQCFFNRSKWFTNPSQDLKSNLNTTTFSIATITVLNDKRLKLTSTLFIIPQIPGQQCSQHLCQAFYPVLSILVSARCHLHFPALAARTNHLNSARHGFPNVKHRNQTKRIKEKPPLYQTVDTET